MFFKKGSLKNFGKFTRRHLCQNLFFAVACKAKRFVIAFPLLLLSTTFLEERGIRSKTNILRTIDTIQLKLILSNGQKPKSVKILVSEQIALAVMF